MGDQPQAIKASRIPLIVSGSIIAALVLSYYLFPGYQHFVDTAYSVLTSGDRSRISAWVDRLGFWGPAFIILAMIVQMFLLVIPSPLLMVVSVLAYGPFWGAALSILAIGISATVGYWLGRYLGDVTVYRLIGERKEKQLEEYVEKYGLWVIVITRFAPMLSNDAISLVGGMLRMNYWKFFGATLLGITPLAVLIAYFGENNERLRNGLLWTSAISLLFFISYVIYDHRTRTGGKDT